METVVRFVELVDRESAESVGIVYAETEDAIQRAHSALNEMSQPEGGPKRTSVKICEVVVDESFG